MTFVLAAAFVALAGVEAWRWWIGDLLLRQRCTRRVLIELHSGETFQGVLGSVDGRTVVLRNVTAVHDVQTGPTVIDGELLIPRVDIKFVQRP